ncbi:PTS sugar transporter subunit IIA [Lacticaseibacillus parakribbianus]|uniref:PTS sugar transporter subunit IIA n=1 Tax=Lacticaseibacillus parakribbianus TaxID=2970927 RepID=UPI0021CAEC97|nr:PTS fructose transporter subunit IIA [Lacticaseibacillus parakribbianus]
MTSLMIASHGHLASGMQSALQLLTGLGKQVTALDAYVDQGDDRPQIAAFVAQASRPAVIFTDLYGGSVNQDVVRAVGDTPDVFVVSQVNLAVVLAVLLDSEPLDAARLDALIAQSQVRRVTLAATGDGGSTADFFD